MGESVFAVGVYCLVVAAARMIGAGRLGGKSFFAKIRVREKNKPSPLLQKAPEEQSLCLVTGKGSFDTAGKVDCWETDGGIT